MRAVARAIVAIVVIVATLLLSGFDATTIASAQEAGVTRHLPVNIAADEQLVDIMGDMLQASATFREQCRQLARIPRVQVHIDLDDGAAPVGRTHRAEGVIRRYQYGRIKAHLRLWSTTGADELIAHELEHVLEYLEGANFRLDSFRHGTRVWLASNGSYETTRAIAAGHRVAEEVSRVRTAQARRAAR